MIRRRRMRREPVTGVMCLMVTQFDPATGKKWAAQCLIDDQGMCESDRAEALERGWIRLAAAAGWTRWQLMSTKVERMTEVTG